MTHSSRTSPSKNTSEPKPASPPITIERDLPFSFEIRPCPFREYRKLAQFHYRAGNPGPVSNTFGLYCPQAKRRLDTTDPLAGIVVYSMPPLNHYLRNLATNYRYTTVADPRSRAQLINAEIRTIARVIIHPQFRSLGLAADLVRKTLPLPNTLFIEASAVMGLINPFFEKAGMKKFYAPADRTREILKAAFDYCRIDPQSLTNPTKTLADINALPPNEKSFLLHQIDKHYLEARSAVFSSKPNRTLPALIPQLAQYILQRPVYYLWQNPKAN